MLLKLFTSTVDNSQQALYVKFNRDFYPFPQNTIFFGRSSSEILGLQGLGRHCLSVQSIDWSVQLPGLYGRYYFVKVLWLHNVVIKSCYMFLMCLKSSEEESKVGQLVS